MTINMLDKVFRFTDKGPMRALALLLALACGFSLIWSSDAVGRGSQVYLWEAFIFLWAVLSALVHGVGFTLSGKWRWIFCAPLSYPILCIALYYFYIARG